MPDLVDRIFAVSIEQRRDLAAPLAEELIDRFGDARISEVARHLRVHSDHLHFVLGAG